MNAIDFTATAYTVESPKDGTRVRYEGEDWADTIEDAKYEFNQLAEMYPNLMKKIVPDHFIQAYCAQEENDIWSGYGGDPNQVMMDIILSLLEKAAIQGAF